MNSIELTFQLSFELWGALFSAVCLLLLFLSHDKNGAVAKALSKLMCVNIFLQIFDCAAYLYRGDTSDFGFFMTRASNFIVFLSEYIIVYLGVAYYYRLLEAKGHKMPKVYKDLIVFVTIIETVALIISQFTNFYYGFDSNNQYYRGTGVYYSFLLEIVVIIIFLVLLIKNKKIIDVNTYNSLLLFITIPVICTILQMFFYGLSLINIGITISIIVLFVVYEYDQLKFIEKQQNDIEHNMDVLRSLACIYISIHSLDLKEDTVTSFVSTEAIDNILDGNKNAAIQIRKVMSLLSSDSYRNQIEEFVDLSTLEERIKGKNVITCEFIGKVNGWCRASFMPIEYDEDGTLRSVTYTVQSINEEKENAKRLMNLSRIDGLTGLLNRLAYENDLEEMKRQNSAMDLTFISLDVNGLKNVNDSLGHEKGDVLLIDAGKCICEVFGDDDASIYRMGGDEFMVITESSEERIAKLCKKFEDVMRKYTDDSYGVLSISYGYCARRENPMKTLKEIVKIADDRMYDMKRKTHNERV